MCKPGRITRSTHEFGKEERLIGVVAAARAQHHRWVLERSEVVLGADLVQDKVVGRNGVVPKLCRLDHDRMERVIGPHITGNRLGRSALRCVGCVVIAVRWLVGDDDLAMNGFTPSCRAVHGSDGPFGRRINTFAAVEQFFDHRLVEGHSTCQE